MLDTKRKQEIIKQFQKHEKDTGSPSVQIAILTEEIKLLTEHLKKHRHDFSSRRGLLRKVNQRRALLRYLQSEDENEYLKLIKKLNLKELKKVRVSTEDILDENDSNDEEEAVEDF